MHYISTRGYERKFSSSEVLLSGLAPDEGLFVPETIPVLSGDEIDRLIEQSYPERAAYIISKFLPDFSWYDLLDAAKLAYDPEKFGEEPAKTVQLNPYNDSEFMLELWHGPTSAFKDMALQMLPHLMNLALAKLNISRKILILTATSGDTGKAALEGFRDVPGTEVLVYYPKGGVSEVQERQMLTSQGSNVHVVGVQGSFDDAQAGVKSAFGSETVQAALDEHSLLLSSANSMNWGRLVPQIAYYWSAWMDLVRREKILPDEKVNFVVPTGNFGNILAAWYAGQMGLPLGKLVCASNRNNVLSDFLRSGEYNARRELFRTTTPSMDILVSSNLERLLFEITGHDSDLVSRKMESLKTRGEFSVDSQIRRDIQSMFVGGFADERGISRTILQVYDETDYMVDPHTAVGFNVYSRYRRRSRDYSPVIYVSTASPFKFADTVASAIFNMPPGRREDQELFEMISKESDLEVPQALLQLSALPLREAPACRPGEIEELLLRVIRGETPVPVPSEADSN